MSISLPKDLKLRARALQRIHQPIGTSTFQGVEEHIGIEINAYWIDTFGILYLQWDWTSDFDLGIKKILDEQAPTHPKKSIAMIDNLSEAGRKAVFMIEAMFPEIDKVISEAIRDLKKSHQWEELVRNAVT